MLDKLRGHLMPLLWSGLIETWHDRNINAGREWEQDVSTQLDEAQIILLLISPAFMNSDYCYSVEMKRAIERHEQGEACVIPVILRPIHWQVTPLDKLQALPKDAKPISLWRPQDNGFVDVAKGVKKVVEQLSIPATTAASLSDDQQEAMSGQEQRINTSEETLYDLLPLCTVKITAAGAGKHGSGFFIAPERILTSLEVIKHVVNLSDPDPDRRQSLIVHWYRYAYAARLTQLTPAFVECGLAVVELHVGGHPCVCLHEDARPSDFFYSYGYPNDYLAGASATFACEGKTMLHKEFIKFKSGVVLPGMIGSPLLNLRTGKVCGVIAHAHAGGNTGNTDGGIAVPVKTIFECMPELKTIQQDYHEKNTRWSECLKQT